MRHSKSALTVVGLIVSAVSLAACSAAPETAPTASAAVETEAWPIVEMTGTGATEKSLTIPEGAVSLRIHFACLGDYFTIATNPGLENDRGGGCQGTRSYLLPLPEYEKMMLDIWVAPDSHFVLTGEFTTDVFTPDPQVAAQCEQLSDFTSRYLNAEQGFSRGEVTAAEWRTRMDGAVEVITGLQETATGLIGLEVPDLVEGITSPIVVPGYFLTEREPTAMDAAGTIVADVCTDNGSGMRIMAEYGG